MIIRKAAVKNINKIIHEPARLIIITNLLDQKMVDVLSLKARTGLTWGNLSIHLKKLDEAGYIRITKKFKNRKSFTLVNITMVGKKTYREYKKEIKLFLK